MRGILAELRKATWLSWRELLYLTGIVLLVSIVLGVFLGAIDYGFSSLIEKVILGV